MPLVAWKRISSPKAEGGLGILDFEQQASLFNLRFVSKLFKQSSSEWATLAKFLIQGSLRKGILKAETKFWTVQEFLHFLPSIPLQSKMLRCPSRSWLLVYLRLELLPTCGIPTEWTMLQIFLLATKGSEFAVHEYMDYRIWTHARGLSTVDDLWANGFWVPLDSLVHKVHSCRNVGFPPFSLGGALDDTDR
jgi:hypothetical protein